MNVEGRDDEPIGAPAVLLGDATLRMTPIEDVCQKCLHPWDTHDISEETGTAHCLRPLAGNPPSCARCRDNLDTLRAESAEIMKRIM